MHPRPPRGVRPALTQVASFEVEVSLVPVRAQEHGRRIAGGVLQLPRRGGGPVNQHAIGCLNRRCGSQPAAIATRSSPRYSISACPASPLSRATQAGGVRAWPAPPRSHGARSASIGAADYPHEHANACRLGCRLELLAASLDGRMCGCARCATPTPCVVSAHFWDFAHLRTAWAARLANRGSHLSLVDQCRFRASQHRESQLEQTIIVFLGARVCSCSLTATHAARCLLHATPMPFCRAFSQLAVAPLGVA